MTVFSVSLPTKEDQQLVEKLTSLLGEMLGEKPTRSMLVRMGLKELHKKLTSPYEDQKVLGEAFAEVVFMWAAKILHEVGRNMTSELAAEAGEYLKEGFIRYAELLGMKDEKSTRLVSYAAARFASLALETPVEEVSTEMISAQGDS